jgi:hypothetical protein
MQAGRSGGAVAWKEIACSGVVASSGGGRRLWRRSKALEEVEGSGGSKHKALETAVSSGGGRKHWRRLRGLETGASPEGSRSKALEGKKEALDAVASSGEVASRKTRWRRRRKAVMESWTAERRRERCSSAKAREILHVRPATKSATDGREITIFF